MHAYQSGRQVATACWLIAFTCLLSACADPSTGGESGSGGAGEAQVVLGPPMSLIPGEAIGPVSVGMTHSELLDALGEPDSDFAFQRLITYRYNSVGLKVEMTSSDATKATDDSRVCGQNCGAGGLKRCGPFGSAPRPTRRTQITTVRPTAAASATCSSAV